MDSQAQDRCRRDTNVFRSKVHAENDTRPYGRHPVRLESATYIYSQLTIICIRLTNDGNAILREIDVAHPAAKNMIELSRTQDEECGDGTTSVIILGTRLRPFHIGRIINAHCSW